MYFISFCILISHIVAPGKTYPWLVLPWNAGRILWVLLSVGLLFPILNLAFQNARISNVLGALEERIARLLQNRFWLISLVCLNAVFQVLNFFQFRHLGYQFPYWTLAASLVTAIWIRKDRSFLICSFSLSILLMSIFSNPLTGFRSDMLLVIKNGLDFLSHGKSPYQLQVFSWGLSGMPYFPGILFSHLPAWLAGIDLRWNLLFFRTIWMSLLFWQIYKTSKKQKSPPTIVHLAHFFVLNPYYNFRHDLYFDFFLLLLVLSFTLLRMRFLWIPLLAVTWQWSWPIIPFMAWDWIWKNRSQPLRNVGLLVLGSLTTFAGILAGLQSTTTWNTFRDQALLLVNSFSSGEHYIKDFGLTLAPLLYYFGISEYSKYLQVGSCLALFVLYTQKKAAGTNEFLRYSTCSLLLFVLLSAHFWQYFWIFPTLWMILCMTHVEKNKITKK
jgi:hypothetical protein